MTSRIDKYLVPNDNGLSSIGVAMAFGHPITGKSFANVKEAYHALLRLDRGGQNGNIPRPDFGAQPSNENNLSEEDVAPSQERMSGKSTRQWMEDYPGFLKS